MNKYADKEVEIAISPFSVARVASVIAIGFVLFDLIGKLIAHKSPWLTVIFARLNIDTEATVPAWYAASLLLICSMILAGIGFGKWRYKDRFALHWLGLWLVFLYLSADEAAQLHEELWGGLAVQFLAPAGGKIKAIFPWSWIPLGIIFALGITLSCWKFLFHLVPHIRQLFVISGALYVGGAIGMEFVGSHIHGFTGNSLIYALTAQTEELLEMLGITVFLYSLLRYVEAERISFRFSIDRTDSA